MIRARKAAPSLATEREAFGIGNRATQVGHHSILPDETRGELLGVVGLANLNFDTARHFTSGVDVRGAEWAQVYSGEIGSYVDGERVSALPSSGNQAPTAPLPRPAASRIRRRCPGVSISRSNTCRTIRATKE